MSFLCQEFFPSVCVSSDINEGLSLKCFVFNHLLPKRPRHEMGQASIRDFESVPKVPTWQGSGCCKMPLKRPFLQLARIQWHLVVVDTFLWKMEDIFFSFPVLWMGKIQSALFDVLKFYNAGFPVKCFIITFVSRSHFHKALLFLLVF